MRQSFDERGATLPSADEIREVKLQHAGNLAGVENTRSISITRTQNGVATVFHAPATLSRSPSKPTRPVPVPLPFGDGAADDGAACEGAGLAGGKVASSGLVGVGA